MAVERIAAAARAARSLPFPFILTARAHNFLYAPSLEDTISRLQAFEKAGADVLFAPGLSDLAAVGAVCAAVANPRLLYAILFRAAAETLLEIAATPKRLGARIGFIAVLHTWTQRLEHHPHLHCVVPAGGLSSDGKRWLSCRPKFFLPVRVLTRLFRGKFLAYLREAFEDNQLRFLGQLQTLEQPSAFQQCMHSLRQAEWVVYAKPPLANLSMS